jgi:DNA ligase (NAD+)
VREHNERYWVSAQPIISDYDYDRLVERLRALAPHSPVLDELGEPAPLAGTGELGAPVRHARPMLSLDKCYDQEGLLKWVERLKDNSQESSQEEHKLTIITVTPKVDGVACSLRYGADGVLILASTRGDGMMGEEITPNVRSMRSIPSQIPPQGVEVEVRGEVYMSLEAFRGHGARFVSPRNAVAGALKRKHDQEDNEALGLRFFAYDLLGDQARLDIPSSSAGLARCAEWGFTPAPVELIDATNPTEAVRELQAAYERYVIQRAELDYEIDGVVYRLDDHARYASLGFTAHHPRAAIAYKLQGESATTTLKEVEWSVSRNGLLTPVGIVEPVMLSGAMVSRISLHNWGMVQAKQLSVGAEVVAMRRGGVIPYLEAVVTPGEEPVTPPAQCPQCPKLCAGVSVEGDQVFCGYEGVCEPQAAAILQHFVKATKIEGFGEVWLDTLTRLKVLTTPVDLYTLTPEKVIKLEGVGQRRAELWVESVNTARRLPLATFLVALGVRDLGPSAAQTIAERFGSLELTRSATVEQLAELYNLAELTATHICEGLKARATLITELLEHIEVLDAPKIERASGPLDGQSFLFTGTLVAMKRAEAQARVKALGGVAASGVSKTLSYLVVGDAGKAGSKLTKAEKLEVPVLSEAEFVTLLEKAEQVEVSEEPTESAEATEATEPTKSTEPAETTQEVPSKMSAPPPSKQGSLFDEL